jgi:hypothetical protein
MEPIRVCFTPTKEDYIKALRAFNLRSTSTIVIFIFLACAGICSFVYITLGSPTRSPDNWILLLSAGTIILMWAISRFVLGPALAGRRVQKNERLRSETYWVVDDAQITIKNEYSEGKADWGVFQRVIDTKEHYLLVHTTNKRLLQILPKRAFESESQEACFRDLLKRHLGFDG